MWNQKKGTHPSHFHHKIISISDYNLNKLSSLFDHIIITLRGKCEVSVMFLKRCRHFFITKLKLSDHKGMTTNCQVFRS